jgi:hypothetical protein
LIQVGFDVQLYRGLGTAGVGGSFGALQYVGKSFFADNTRSNDTTVFNELPVTLQLFYRFDWLPEHTILPFVPYARGGLAYHFWWTTTGVGDVSRATVNGQDFIGRGGKIGVTGTVGLAILLNSFEPLSAHRLFELTSIRGTYIFVELQASKVNGFGGNGFDFSATSWNAGLYLEF